MPNNASPLPVAFSAGETIDDSALLKRIIASYRVAVAEFPGHGASMWEGKNLASNDVHEALTSGDVAAAGAKLRNPHTTELFYGFFDIYRRIHAVEIAADEAYRQKHGRRIAAQLVTLAEAVGAIRIGNPEDDGSLNPPVPDTEGLLTALDDAFGFRVEFRNPYPHELGLVTSRGIVGHRAIQALYQAWRIAGLAPSGQAPRVLEIGGGLGLTAFYARSFGITDYTIVDIPLTSVAQADFLGRTLGEKKLSLLGETETSRDRIRLVGPRWLEISDERFDIAFNCDSLTEMDQATAVGYFRTISRRADLLLSINHEINSFRAADLPALAGVPVKLERNRYWLRDGYAEELAYFSGRTAPDAKAEIERLTQLAAKQQRTIQRLDRQFGNSRRELLRRLIDLTFRRG